MEGGRTQWPKPWVERLELIIGISEKRSIWLQGLFRLHMDPQSEIDDLPLWIPFMDNLNRSTNAVFLVFNDFNFVQRLNLVT